MDNIAGTTGVDTINAVPVNATGAADNTLSAFDSIDGGAGNDTLNIYSAGLKNATLNGATVKNVETININNSGAAAFITNGTEVDASKFVGATAINQNGLAAAVTNLAAGTVAGFNGVASSATAPLSVAAAAGVASASVNLDGVKGIDSGSDSAFQAGDNTAGLKVQGAALNTVTVTGTLAQAVTSTVAGQEATLALEVVAGKDSAGKGLQTVTVNSAVNTSLTVTDTVNTEKVTTVDASVSTGAITFAGDADAATIKTGAGADVVSVAANTSSTLSASVSTGAGNDKITVDTANVGLTSATGTTTVEAGAGDDQVDITSRSSGKLTLNLGDGNDTFSTGTGVAINGTDVINGGAGTDTLALSVVGSANIGAFTNFEVFDTVGMNKALDVDILATKNTVTEFVASGDVGGSAALINMGAGVGFRATGDMTTNNTLALTQKTAGALTVTLDADSTSTTAENDTNLMVDATNATSLKAVFGVDSGFVQTSTATNDQTIALTGDKATSLEVVSGGTNASNVLDYTEGNDGSGKGLLTSVTISGSQDLDITGLDAVTAATQLATVDASGFTGKLTADLADLKSGAGTLKLGSGADTVIATAAGSNAQDFESIANFSKAAAAAVGTDATAAAKAQAAADHLELASAAVTADHAAAGADLYAISHGVLTFTGAGPSTLDAALTIADNATLGAVGNAVEFEYLGNSYVFAQGSTTAAVDTADTLVQLVGITGVTNFAEVGTTDQFVIV